MPGGLVLQVIQLVRLCTAIIKMPFIQSFSLVKAIFRPADEWTELANYHIVSFSFAKHKFVQRFLETKLTCHLSHVRFGFYYQLSY